MSAQTKVANLKVKKRDQRLNNSCHTQTQFQALAINPEDENNKRKTIHVIATSKVKNKMTKKTHTQISTQEMKS